MDDIRVAVIEERMLKERADASGLERTRWLEVFELEENATIVDLVSTEFEVEMIEPTILQLWKVQMTRSEGFRSKDLRA